MTIQEIHTKFSNIEEKIPSVFSSYQEAGIQLAQALLYHWDISDNEIIRVIALIGIHTNIDLSNHINSMFAFVGLYPTIQNIFNIKPE
jgi:hypothetical protein